MTMKTFDPKAFLEFVRSKPADERYPWSNSDACALAQFGFPGVVEPTAAGIPMEVYVAAVDVPSSWGSLATRLEQALND